jgi:DNA polymerase-3 subunit beta
MMLPADEYPQLPKAGDYSAGFDGQQLAAALAWTTPFAGKDDTLPALTCVQVTLDGEGTATLVATDRYRLALATCSYEPGATVPDGPVLLPAKRLAATPKARRPADEDYILLELAGSDVAGIDAGTRYVTIRPTAGQYPDYRKVLPDPAKVTTTVTASIATLAAAVKRAAIVAERNTPIRLHFEAGEACLESGTGDEAGYADTIPASIDGDPVDIAFNPAYLLEALAATAGAGAASARIALAGSTTPALITPADPEVPGRSHVLVPIRSAG